VQLYRWRSNERNFGDELNCLLWPRLLPNFFDDDAAVLFLGIGSVLDARHPAGAVKLVAGAGYGGYESSPTLDARWVIHWVRGPRTARVLCLPITCGLGDPAMLLAAPPTDGGRAIGFMPHFESLGRGAWAEAARAAGMTLIDPRDDPDAIIQHLLPRHPLSPAVRIIPAIGHFSLFKWGEPFDAVASRHLALGASWGASVQCLKTQQLRDYRDE
jgi:hypothetical protein